MVVACPKCGSQNPENQATCGSCGTDLTAQQGDATGGIIPYKNPKALIAYYLGIVSGLPMIGLPIGIVAFVLGILGLRDRKRNPVIRGGFHASVGIGCGGFFALLWGLVIVMILIAIIAEA